MTIEIPIKNINMINLEWQPFDTIPSDREVLIAYGKVNGGPCGYDIVGQLGGKWVNRYGNRYPNVFMDWIIIGWMDLPSFPEV